MPVSTENSVKETSLEVVSLDQLQRQAKFIVLEMKCSLKIHLIDHPDEQQRFQQRYEEACRYIDELARRASTQQ